MSEHEDLIQGGECVWCHQHTNRRAINPYDSEIKNEDHEDWLHEQCEQELAMEI